MASKAKFNEENEQGYRVDVVGRNVEITDPIRAYIWDKLDRIEKFHNHILHVHATLEIQKVEHVCTLLLKIDHTQVKAQAVSTDMYASIDKAIDKLASLLSRYKGRIQDHHKKKLAIVDMSVNVLHQDWDEVAEINAEIDAANHKKNPFSLPKVIGTETKALKTLTLKEALMKLDLLGDQFLIFRSEEDQKLKVLYRRKDGHYGLIQPE